MHRFIYAFISVITCLDCDVCQRQCDDNLAQCLTGCDGVPACMSACSRELVQCETECTAKCGEHIELLLLNPNKDEQFHINLSPGGEEIITPIEFTPSYDDRHWMCSFSLFGKMYLIGGNDGMASERRQLQVTLDGIEVLEQLPFRFNDGRCLNYDDEHVLACAGDFGYQKECFKFDGANYTRMALTQFDHFRGGMARWRSQALIMGGYYNGAGTVELFDDSINQWSRVSENEMLEKFYGFTSVGILDTVFTFGGALRRENVIGKLDCSLVTRECNYNDDFQ